MGLTTHYLMPYQHLILLTLMLLFINEIRSPPCILNINFMGFQRKILQIKLFCLEARLSSMCKDVHNRLLKFKPTIITKMLKMRFLEQSKSWNNILKKRNTKRLQIARKIWIRLIINYKTKQQHLSRLSFKTAD